MSQLPNELIDSILEFGDDYEIIAPNFRSEIRKQEYIIGLFERITDSELLNKLFIWVFNNVKNYDIVKHMFVIHFSHNIEDFIDDMAMRGRLNVIKWVFDTFEFEFAGNTNAMDGAAINGHFHVLLYLHEMGGRFTELAFEGAILNARFYTYLWLLWNDDRFVHDGD